MTSTDATPQPPYRRAQAPAVRTVMGFAVPAACVRAGWVGW